MSDWRSQIRPVPVDTSKFDQKATTDNTRETARTTAETRKLIQQLVEHAVETAHAAEVRERQMLRWTQAGVVLAAVAALASLVAIVVTLIVGG